MGSKYRLIILTNSESTSFSQSHSKKGLFQMNQYPIRYAFRLDPATEKALEQIARHTFQSKASIMRRYVQEGVANDAKTGL